MSANSISEALSELTKSKNRSLTAQLRDVFDDVEKALSAGVSRAEVLDTLNKQGLEISKDAFGSALYRIRKERKERKEEEDEKVSTKDPAALEENPTQVRKGGYKSSAELKKEREQKSSGYMASTPKKRFD